MGRTTKTRERWIIQLQTFVTPQQFLSSRQSLRDKGFCIQDLMIKCFCSLHSPLTFFSRVHYFVCKHNRVEGGSRGRFSSWPTGITRHGSLEEPRRRPKGQGTFYKTSLYPSPAHLVLTFVKLFPIFQKQLPRETHDLQGSWRWLLTWSQKAKFRDVILAIIYTMIYFHLSKRKYRK